MKRILIALLMLAVVLSAAACTNTPNTPDTPDVSDTDTPATDAPVVNAKNEGELKAGVYTATVGADGTFAYSVSSIWAVFPMRAQPLPAPTR